MILYLALMAKKKTINTYFAKLNTPQWKAKRLRILKRDRYRCTVCGCKTDLQVHHTYYFNRKIDPWEYPNKSLLTVCGNCHVQYHESCEVEIRDVSKKKKKPLSVIEIQSQSGLRIRKKDGSYLYVNWEKSCYPLH